MTYQIRIATADIQLCKIDKRKRYGLEAIGKITAGEVFQFRNEDIVRKTNAHVEFGGPNGDKYGKSLWEPELIEEVLTKSQPKPAATPKEVFMMHNLPFDRCADEIINTLVQTGVITLKQVDGAISAWVKKLQENEA